MKTRTGQILALMHVLAWVVFIGLMIDAGAMLVSYGVSIINPEAAKNLYKGLNLSVLRQYSFLYYTITILWMVTLSAVKAYIAWLVVKLLSKIKLTNPFTVEISMLLERIGYYLLSLWVSAMLYDVYTVLFVKNIYGVPKNLVSGDFIFLAGLILVFAQIFKKGVEFQSENELTV